jgi:cytochrome c peroxidase
VAVTAPYMHNGMFKTLKEVIEYYDNPSKFIKNPINIDHRLSKPLGLSAQEKADLEAFLRSLTDDQFANQFPNR